MQSWIGKKQYIQPKSSIYWLFCCLLLLLFSIISCGKNNQPEPSPSPSPSTSPVASPLNQEEESSILDDYRIALDYSSKWKIQARDIESPWLLNAIELVDLFPWTNGTREENVSISILLETPGKTMSLEEFYQQIAMKKLNAYSEEKLGEYGNEILERQKITLADERPAYQILYSRSDGRNKVKGMIVFTLREQTDNLVYLIHYRAEEAKFDKFLPEAEQIAKSLKLTE